jgi:HAMP domain-containing protein
MTNKPATAEKPRTNYSSLPLKITGIVFWGLVLVGLVASTAFISFLESRLATERDLKLDLTHDTVEQLVNTPGRDSADELTNALELLQARFGFTAIEVQYDSKLIGIGKQQPGLDISRRSFQTNQHGISGENDSLRVEVKVFQPLLKDQVASLRKNILILMAVIFLGFGFILQIILKRVLSLPVTRMVQTADGIVKGDNTLRFDDKRDDEFGFLGKFINRVLDHLTTKQEELENSLSGQKLAEQFLSREKERAEITLYSISDCCCAFKYRYPACSS